VADLMNLPVTPTNRLLANELAEIAGKIHDLDEGKQRLLLGDLKGMLNGLKS
jgi:hypothetical protein